MPSTALYPLFTTLSETLSAAPGEYAVAVKGLATGRQLYLNNKQMRSASLIKIFIMIEAFRQVEEGLLDFDATTEVTADVQVGGAGPLEHVTPGTRQTWRQLVELMITESDNTATNILIQQLSPDKINRVIEELGCTNSVLQRNMMDFASAEAGRENYTSVADLVTVLEKLFTHKCLGPEQDKAMLAIMRRQQDKCKLPLHLPEFVAVAHKTGELDGAEHDAGVVYGARFPYAIAVMADNLPDAVQGRETIANISRTVYDFLHKMD